VVDLGRLLLESLAVVYFAGMAIASVIGLHKAWLDFRDYFRSRESRGG